MPFKHIEILTYNVMKFMSDMEFTACTGVAMYNVLKEYPLRIFFVYGGPADSDNDGPRAGLYNSESDDIYVVLNQAPLHHTVLARELIRYFRLHIKGVVGADNYDAKFYGASNSIEYLANAATDFDLTMLTTNSTQAPAAPL